MSAVQTFFVLALLLASLELRASALSAGANVASIHASGRRPRGRRQAELQLHQVIRRSEGAASWEHLPASPRLAIVTGGAPDIFREGKFGSKTLAIMLNYARKHNYALHVDRNLSRFSGRSKSWNKIRLLQQLLSEVPILVWMDSDVVLRNLSIPLHEILNTSRCDAVEQSRWEPYLSPSPTLDTFLWLSADMMPNHYLVNVNTGVMAIRSTALARQFLDGVWKFGDDEQHFKHHHDPWAWTSTGRDNPNYGWPWEQGAVWDALAAEPERYLRGTCVAPIGVLQSVRPYLWSAGQLAQHCSAMSEHARAKAAQFVLSRLDAGPQQQL